MTAVSGARAIQNDPSLSFTALGLWSYLFCQAWPDDKWPPAEEIINSGRGEPAEIRAALEDLRVRGFLKMGA